MKSLVLCLILVLSVLIHQGLTASVRGNEIMNSADRPALHETEEFEVQESLFRSKRHLGLHMCIYCCKCCKTNDCGFCCRT